MAQRESPPVESDEEGEHIPNLDIRLPDLVAARGGGDPDDYDYPVGEYPIPDLEEQDVEPIE